MNLHENAREAVAPDTAQASRSSRIKVDAGIAGIEVGAGIEIVSRIAAEENAATATNDNDGAIPAEVTENIFTPFFTTKPDGSGIGLSVSRRIMQLHKGSLRLTANTDNRVTFTLLFG